MPDLTELAARHARLHRDALVSRIANRLQADTPDWLAADPAVQHGSARHLDPDAALTDFEAELQADFGRRATPLPLLRLPRPDARLLMALSLIEQDVRFGALFARLQDPLPSRRPCLGLLNWLLPDQTSNGLDLQARAQGLLARGLLSIDNLADPRSEWVARLPVPVWDLVHRGRLLATSLPAGLRLRPAADFPELAELVLPGELAELAERLPELVEQAAISAIVVRGMTASGRLTLLGSVARALGRDTLVHRTVGPRAGADDRAATSWSSEPSWQLLAPLAELADAQPVLRAQPGPGANLAIPPMPGLARPLGIVLGRSGGLSGPVTERAIGYTLGYAGKTDRHRLWRDSIEAAPAELDVIAESFLLTPGTINRAAALANAAATAAGRTSVGVADVRTASRSLQRQTLETLATRLSPLASDSPPVLSPAAADEIATLLARCRHREALAEAGSGLGGAGNRGVRALFSGPSGTGKTFSARHLAGRLNLDVYRVDLAAVVNKYIGETERNLDEVLGRAEELDVLLLLDEGDALLTRRTEVSNANDRYANLETNFLLQRLETFDGIVVITTNAGNRIDPAFLRRIDVTVDFVPPDADQRRQLWLSHLPADQQVVPATLADIARRCPLTGGQIRNASLHARLLSLEHGEPVTERELLPALQREYRRIGASFPLAGRTLAGQHPDPQPDGAR